MSTCPHPGKQRHASRDLAAAHQRWLQRARGANDDLSVYACGDHWHVGHSPIALSKRIRQALRRGE